jgi:hypothetical protein
MPQNANATVKPRVVIVTRDERARESLVLPARSSNYRELAQNHRLMAHAQSLPSVQALFRASTEKWDFLADLELVTESARTPTQPSETNVSHPLINLGKLNVDLRSKRVEVLREPVRLTAMEYVILELLAKGAPGIVQKATVRDHL